MPLVKFPFSGRALAALMLIAAANMPAFAGPMTTVEQSHERMVDGIQDNSFLIEEAYNQEPGVVQHILNVLHGATRHAGADNDDLTFVFTQEWPVFSQTHQFSFSVPYTFFDEAGRSDSGFEDIGVTYRWQALMESGKTPAFAPAFSLTLPAGDEDRDLGDGRVGYEITLPASKTLSDRWAVHANAGLSVLPDVDDHDLVGYSLGGSVIYAVAPRFNLLLEVLAEWDEEIDDNGGTSREAAVVVSPGLRYAFNHPNDAQTVVGIAAPIGVTSAAPDISVLLYFSFEHSFLRPKSSAQNTASR